MVNGVGNKKNARPQKLIYEINPSLGNVLRYASGCAATSFFSLKELAVIRNI